jgi:hypothetical protein
MKRDTLSVVVTYALSSLATPVAVWLGCTLFFVAKFGGEGFVVRVFWHTLLCFYIALGSMFFSFPLLALRRVRIHASILKQVFWPSAVCLGVLLTTALFLYTGRTTSDQSGIWPIMGFFLFGLALNGLVFLRLNWSWNMKEGKERGQP